MRTTLTIDDALTRELKMRALETGKTFGQVVIDSATNKVRMARKSVGYGNAVWFPNGRINNQLKQAIIETADLAIRSRKGCLFAGLSKLLCGRLNNETLLNGLRSQVARKVYRLKPASLGTPLARVNLDKALQLADENVSNQ